MTADDGQPPTPGPWQAAVTARASVPSVAGRLPSGPVDAAMTFDATRAEVSPLVRKGVLLQILTLGLYRSGIRLTYGGSIGRIPPSGRSGLTIPGGRWNW